MSLLEHMAYDNNQASVLVVSHLEYICTQQFEYLKRLRAHFMHIDLALFVKLPLTSLIPALSRYMSNPNITLTLTSNRVIVNL